MKPIGLFGGTFDPIHYGHLRTAFELLQVLRLAELRFIPAGNPPHRDRPLADARQRLALVRAAIGEQPGFVVDDREVRRDAPSYTIDTLAELRDELPAAQPLCLIVGMDAFLGLTSWRRWREILDRCHLVVAHRPGWSEPTSGELDALLAERRTSDVAELHERSAGRILVQAVTPLEISSSELRALLAAGRDPRFLMPDAVRALIHETACYARPGPAPARVASATPSNLTR